jgi:hypothetical protein
MILILLLILGALVAIRKDHDQDQDQEGRFTIFPLRPAMPGAYVPNLMRLFLRRACLVLATGSLVFFLSCERHRVGELPDEHETKAPAEDHASMTHESHASPSPVVRNTPANFFPDKPKP